MQIQLEKIRAAEHEVRWQHEEDIEECSNCRQPFSVTKRKVCFFFITFNSLLLIMLFICAEFVSIQCGIY